MSCPHYIGEPDHRCVLCDDPTIAKLGNLIIMDELGLVEALRPLPLPKAICMKAHIEALAQQNDLGPEREELQTDDPNYLRAFIYELRAANKKLVEELERERGRAPDFDIATEDGEPL